MVAIKDMKMPKYCNDCDFVTDSFGYCNRAEEHIPNYEFFSETNERPDFCPLVEIGTCKDCRNASESQYNKCIYCSLIEHNCSEDFYCKEYKKRGSEDGSN